MNSAITWESIDQGTRLSIRDLARSTIETIRRLLSLGRERADTGTATRVLIEIAIDEMIRTGATEEQVLELMAQALHGAQGRTGSANRRQGGDASHIPEATTANPAEAANQRAASPGESATWDADVPDGQDEGRAGPEQAGTADGVAWGDEASGSSSRAEQGWGQEQRKAAKTKIEVASGAIPGYPYRVQLVSPEGNVVRVLSVRGGEYDIKVWLRQNIDKFPGYGWRLINPSGVLIASEDPK